MPLSMRYRSKGEAVFDYFNELVYKIYYDLGHYSTNEIIGVSDEELRYNWLKNKISSVQQLFRQYLKLYKLFD